MKAHAALLATLFIQGQLLHAQAPTCTWAAAATLDLSATSFTQYPHYQIAADPMGGALLMGMHTWIRNYSADHFGTLQFVHYGTDGAVDWQLECGGVAQGYRVRYAPDGSIHACGEYLDSLRLGPAHLLSTTENDPQVFYAKFDEWGNVVWAMDLSEAFAGARDPNALTFDATGVAYLGFFGDGGTRIARFDPAGELLAVIEQNPPTLFDVDVDALGYVYVTGSCAPATNTVFAGVPFQPNVSGNGYNRYLVRYSPEGLPTWARFSGDVTCSTSEVRSFGPEGVYWAGYMVTGSEFGGHQLNGPANGSTPDMHICRLDSAGEYEWVREGPVGQNTGVGPGMRHYLDLDEEGNLLVAGNGRGTLDWGNGIVEVVNGVRDAALMCFAPNGEILWMKRGDGPGSFDEAHSVARCPDGSIVIVGLTRNDITFDQQTVVANGTVSYPFVAHFAPEIGTGVTEPGGYSGGIFPNPTEDVLWLSSGGEVLRAQGMDVLGRSSTLPHGPGWVDARGLAPGTYSLLIVRPSGERSLLRFVKQ